MMDQLKAGNASQIEIDKQIKEMENMSAMLNNPFYNAMMTYQEILPVGEAMALISSFILKRKSAINTNNN